ncbi:MAG: alpha/beta hydrolase [Bacteroidales bacterium]|nr:alpha/beta hydrolase [Bacteroidales bacterium]
MKRLVFILALLLAAAQSLGAQETYLFAKRDTCDLYLDVYRPEPGSQTLYEGKEKPTILFVFGGGFIIGSRNGKHQVAWFQKLSQEGYGVVAIDYRLGMKGYKVGKGLSGTLEASKQFYLSQQMGVEDVFSAVSFLAAHPECGVDVNNLVISGSSAGAIISLAAEYDICCGRTEGLPEGFNFKGVMSFAGGIISNSGAPVFKQEPCPILFLHGTADKAVAYNQFGAFGKGIWGSSFLAKQLKNKKYPHCIYRFDGRTHDVAAYMYVLLGEEITFLEQCVIMGHRRNLDALVDDPDLPTWGNISVDDIYKRN